MMPSMFRRRADVAIVGMVVAWGVMLCSLGCARGRQYTASKLPPEYQPPPVWNSQTYDITGFSPPVRDNETIDYGDVLEVSIASGLGKDDVTTCMVRVGDDGAAYLPEIGALQLAGLPLVGAEQQIAMACRQHGLILRPQVTATMKHQRVNRITVVGGVRSPGIKELTRGTSYLMPALVAAGGLTDDAGTSVEIRCPSQPGRLALEEPGGTGRGGVQLASNQTPGVQLICLNLSKAAKEVEGNRYLPDGTVISVEKRQMEPIHVLGLVNKPCQFEYPAKNEVRVLGAIAQAGGVTVFTADKVLVTRKSPDGNGSAAIEVSIRRAKQNLEENLRLAPGDTVSVEETPITVTEHVFMKAFNIGIGISPFNRLGF